MTVSVRVRGRSEGCGMALSCGKNTSKQLDLLRRMYGNKCWQECRKRETVSIVGRMYIGAATKENSMEVPQKILELKKKNTGTTTRSSNPISGYFSAENKNTYSKRYMHTYVHSWIISNSHDMEAVKVPNRWIKHLWCMYIQ